MCTVSYIVNKDSFIITSNRDEHIGRPLAFMPKEETINGMNLIYPKDPKAGGSWFAVNENHAVTVLLNGAFNRHQSGGKYLRSRGLVLLDVASSTDPWQTLQRIKLDRIEPFTIVLLQEFKLFEFRWDGTEKFFKEMDPKENYIWSSTTLYTDEVIQTREKLFQKFIDRKVEKDARRILDFHTNDHNDRENGFIIDRENGLKTFSITQAIIQQDLASLRHIDLLNRKDHLLTLGDEHLIRQL